MKFRWRRIPFWQLVGRYKISELNLKAYKKAWTTQGINLIEQIALTKITSRTWLMNITCFYKVWYNWCYFLL